MKPNHLIQSTILAGFLLAGATAFAGDEDSQATIQFSDPSKPGLLKIDLMMADIHVVGADTKEISIRADTPLDDGHPRKDGLRSIGGGSAYRVTESGNVVSIDAGDMYGMGGHGMATFQITVPRSTSVVLKVLHGGDTEVRGVSGDVEVTNQNGDLRLVDVSGGVAADTMNGEIKAVFTKLTEGKTYAFASMNGEIDLRVPAAAKATVRFRAQIGEILTDFDEKQLVTRSDNTVVVETPEAVEAPEAPPAPEPLPGRRTPKPPKAPKVPRLPFPSFGGQVVSGTLNGGGPELIATTMRGTITLRKTD